MLNLIVIMEYCFRDIEIICYLFFKYLLIIVYFFVKYDFNCFILIGKLVVFVLIFLCFMVRLMFSIFESFIKFFFILCIELIKLKCLILIWWK